MVKLIHSHALSHKLERMRAAQRPRKSQTEKKLPKRTTKETAWEKHRPREKNVSSSSAAAASIFCSPAISRYIIVYIIAFQCTVVSITSIHRSCIFLRSVSDPAGEPKRVEITEVFKQTPRKPIPWDHCIIRVVPREPRFLPSTLVHHQC